MWSWRWGGLLALLIGCGFGLALAKRRAADENRSCHKGGYEFIHAVSIDVVDEARPYTQFTGNCIADNLTPQSAHPRGEDEVRHHISVQFGTTPSQVFMKQPQSLGASCH
jgi:hypothetical protein